MAGGIDSVNLNDALCQVGTDSCNLAHGTSPFKGFRLTSTPQSWHSMPSPEGGKSLRIPLKLTRYGKRLSSNVVWLVRVREYMGLAFLPWEKWLPPYVYGPAFILIALLLFFWDGPLAWWHYLLALFAFLVSSWHVGYLDVAAARQECVERGRLGVV